MTGAELAQVAGVTLQVAVASTAASLVPGTALGWYLARSESPQRTWLEALVMIPMVVPPVAAGLALLTFLSWLEQRSGVSLIFTWQAAALASTVMAFPLLVRSVQQAVADVPRTLEQSAATLGASPWTVAWTITLPLARRGIVSGLLLAFARGLGEFGATMLVAGIIPGSTETLATGIYSRIVNNHVQDAWTLTAVAVCLAFAAVFLAQRVVRD